MKPFDWQFPYASQRMPVLARNIVSTSQPLAAQAGIRMMLKGGNAVDAILATAIALTIVEPTSNGIGSDAFCILWDGKKLHGLNASGRSPAGWSLERFKGQPQMPARGWESVTVPGAVSAWVELSEKFGKLPFADLFEPAIKYAAEGYMVSPTIARQWAAGAHELHAQPGFADAFMPRGRALEPGEKFSFPAQAKTLQRIAESKGEAFYRGELAEKIAAFAKQHGAALSLEDMAAHKNDWVDPIGIDYRGYTLHEIPPNGQGIAALVALGILENFDIEGLPVDSVDMLHVEIEAMKLAFADTYEFVSDPSTMRVKPSEMLDKAYLKDRAKLIDMKKAKTPTFGHPSRGGTVYLTAADESGMMVSYIQSNFSGFGSGVVVPGTGISLQNRGYGFSVKPDHPNVVAPRKRPFHTIIPGFVTHHAQPLMSFGVMGGSMQAQGHMQVMSRMVDYKQNPQAAADAPRWRIDSGLKVGIEHGVSKEVLEGLRARGHDLQQADRWSTDFGRAQLIYKMDDGYCGASERRTDGQAVGY
ncbi:MAG TPA: gamma-glutamyltransferase family protein [Burkholderiales bacterium]|nr:gamma-glutamyltransferase family protein [Burkholderiales bacterium]